VASRRRDSGYALLAVLWITVGITALTFLIGAAAREAIATSRNRIALTQATWATQACVADMRAALSDSIDAQAPIRTGAALEIWNRLDRIVAAGAAPPCALTVRAVGSRMDVNAIDAETLASLLRNLGLACGLADSTAAAFSAWKAAHAEPLVNLQQLHLVPGFESLSRTDSVLDVEPGAVSLNHAPPEVLALLPGFTEEAIEKLLDIRSRGGSITTLGELSEMLSPGARTEFDRAFPQLVGTTLLAPSAWIVTIRSSAGVPAVTVALEVRLVRSGNRARIVRRRSWIE